MKNKSIKILFLTLFFTNLSYSADPAYEINIGNFNFIAANILEFNIYLKHTNPSESTFEYSMGQFVFNFNTAYANGGTLTYSYSPTNPVSDLPSGQRPLNPNISYNQLRLTTRVPPGYGNGYTISSTGNGTLIAKMRLSTTAGSFAGTLSNLNLTLRDVTDGGFYTKIVAYVFDKSKNITNPSDENIVSGKLFYDNNSNGFQDIGELPYSYALLTSAPFISYSTSNENGNYYMRFGPGTFNISVPIVPFHYSIVPLTQTVNFPGVGQTQPGIDFAITPNSPTNDLRISLSNMRPRPGFNSFQYINYINIGNTTLSGSINLVYDDLLTYEDNYTFPLPDSHNPTTFTLGWDFLNLLPGESRIIRIEYNLPSTVALGTNLTSASTINPVSGDYNPSDNVYTVNEIVRGSYDPNDKNVDLKGKITPEEIADEDSLTYTVRFQNTGTDTAFTVRVLDTLSSKLNIPTIEMLASSHDYTYTITGAGIVEWTFNNILLPDSTTNEPASHGFIKYRVRPKNNLVLGDEIKNTAYIYFDYNVPVVTNTVNTVVGYNSKYLDLRCRLQAMFPVSDTLTVYMRNNFAPYDIADSAKVYTDAALPDYYKMVIAFENIVQGNSYYLSINHRNSIETWSANPVMISNDTTVYDFTTSSNQAYGDNMTEVNGKFCFFSGDVNKDGIIEGSDLLLIDNDAAISVPGYIVTDLNGDEIVDGSDAAIAENNAANFVSVNKP